MSQMRAKFITMDLLSGLACFILKCRNLIFKTICYPFFQPIYQKALQLLNEKRIAMRSVFIVSFSMLSLLMVEASGQRAWKLQKQEDGISIYTAHQEDTRILAYRIEAMIQGELGGVYRQVIDFQGNKKYLETVKQLDVLEKRTNQQVLVYMLFDLPWPFRDRDFVKGQSRA